MQITRRSLLRNVAVASAAAAVAPMSLVGCEGNGLRVFFVGSWLFCRHPDPRKMYAIARNMDDIQHIFPFGLWQQQPNYTFDHSMPSLTPSKKGEKPVPATIDVPGFKSTMASLTALFAESQKSAPIVFIDGQSNQLALDLTVGNLVAVELPIPSSLLPAGYYTQAKIEPTTLLHPPNSGTSYACTGYPTAHIFQYDGASSLTLTAGSLLETVHATDQNTHLHFHTVPNAGDGCDHSTHMVRNLIQVLKRGGTSLGDKDLKFDIVSIADADYFLGPNAAVLGVTEAELDHRSGLHPNCSMDRPEDPKADGQNVDNRLIDLASCSGPGMGYDG